LRHGFAPYFQVVVSLPLKFPHPGERPFLIFQESTK